MSSWTFSVLSLACVINFAKLRRIQGQSEVVMGGVEKSLGYISTGSGVLGIPSLIAGWWFAPPEQAPFYQTFFLVVAVVFFVYLFFYAQYRLLNHFFSRNESAEITSLRSKITDLESEHSSTVSLLEVRINDSSDQVMSLLGEVADKGEELGRIRNELSEVLHAERLAEVLNDLDDHLAAAAKNLGNSRGKARQQKVSTFLTLVAVQVREIFTPLGGALYVGILPGDSDKSGWQGVHHYGPSVKNSDSILEAVKTCVSLKENSQDRRLQVRGVDVSESKLGIGILCLGNKDKVKAFLAVALDEEEALHCCKSILESFGRKIAGFLDVAISTQSKAKDEESTKLTGRR